MSERNHTQESTTPLRDMEHHLTSLKLACIAAQYAELAKRAVQKEWSHVDYLARLLEGEADLRRDRATKSRIRLAHFPVIKTLAQFRWDWPTRINRLQGQHHFRRELIKAKANLILLGGVGLGKPQPGNYPSRLQCSTGTHHHGP
jgi:DNA replication protein DnaC